MLIERNGHRIYYDLNGPDDGPIVCMTHSLASDSGMWAEQMPALLGAGYRVLRIDMRGHGGSDAVDGPYAMSDLSDDVVMVLDTLGLGKVHFIGLSIGGMIGQMFASHHADRTLSAMLCDTVPGSPEGMAEAWKPRRTAVEEAGNVAVLADATMDRWFTSSFKDKNPARWSQIHATIENTTAAGFLGCASAIAAFNAWPHHASIAAPTLVVCGALDEGTPPAGNKLIAEAVPNGRYEEIPETKHMPNVERPDIFNAIMMGWLKSQTA
jgi:3-oxoadipate enol-lactonase